MSAEVQCDSLNTKGTCPDCGSPAFVLGPRGGLAINIKCAMCGHKFCFSPPFPPMRIDNLDEFYTGPTVNLASFMESDE